MRTVHVGAQTLWVPERIEEQRCRFCLEIEGGLATPAGNLRHGRRRVIHAHIPRGGGAFPDIFFWDTMADGTKELTFGASLLHDPTRNSHRVRITIEEVPE
ncbi:MAG: hypothetical protein WC326_08305 [Candidatus Delongbacteria bacterium]